MEIDADPELPEEVITAIRAKRKIEAIKLLREHWGLDLKEAKQAVDAYERRHPEEVAMQPLQVESGLGRLLLVALVLFAMYLAYSFLS